VGDLISPLSSMLTSLSIRERVPQIEVAVADNAVALILRVLDTPSPADLDRLREFAAAHAVRLYLQPGGLDSVRELAPAGGHSGNTEREGGPAAPRTELLRYGLPAFGVELEFTPTDFIQINGAVNEALVSRAVELLELTPSAAVLDLYCGIGNFTLALAKSAGRVAGVEGDAALVERARHNARRNNIENAEFHVADLAQSVDPGVAWLRQPYSHVLLDPPRVGAREVLAAVARLAPQRVLYISCHPGSLARDLGVLVHEHGFTLQAAGVVDMFPHTAHVESLALLQPGAHSA
jgi:23S rRNA (uracil1939-C5)-methyltransferase